MIDPTPPASESESTPQQAVIDPSEGRQWASERACIRTDMTPRGKQASESASSDSTLGRWPPVEKEECTYGATSYVPPLHLPRFTTRRWTTLPGGRSFRRRSLLALLAGNLVALMFLPMFGGFGRVGRGIFESEAAAVQGGAEVREKETSVLLNAAHCRSYFTFYV